MELLRGRHARAHEEIYELLSMKNALPEEAMHRRDLFWKGIIFYRQQLWDKALEEFRAALPAEGADGPLQFYIRRTEQLREGLPSLEWSQTQLGL